MNDPQPDFSLEAKMQELRGLLNQMQSGSLDFDTNIKLFTQGTGLIQECRAYLDGAEMSVKKLTGGAEEPFSAEDGRA